MTLILYIIGLFILAFYQIILSELLSIYGINIDLAALFVVMVSLYKSETVAIWFAVATAIVLSAPQLSMMPWEILFLSLIAVGVTNLRSRLNLDTSLSKLSLLAFFLLFHGLAVSLVVSSDSFFYLIYRNVLPGVLYTLVFAWVYLVIADIIGAPRRLKESS